MSLPTPVTMQRASCRGTSARWATYKELSIMKPFVRLFVLALLPFVGVGCATATKGTVSGGVYQSPLNNFTVVVPRTGPGLKIQDQNDNEGGRVSFHDDFGNVVAITYSRLPEGSETVFKDSEKRDAVYSGFLKVFAVPKLFSRVTPDARVVREEFQDNGDNRVFFAVVSLPGGSTLVDRKQNKRLDSVRGILVFHKGGFIYMLENEMNNGLSNVFNKVNPSSLTPKQIEMTQSALNRVKGTMVFQTDAAKNQPLLAPSPAAKSGTNGVPGRE